MKSTTSLEEKKEAEKSNLQNANKSLNQLIKEKQKDLDCLTDQLKNTKTELDAAKNDKMAQDKTHKEIAAHFELSLEKASLEKQSLNSQVKQLERELSRIKSESKKKLEEEEKKSKQRANSFNKKISKIKRKHHEESDSYVLAEAQAAAQSTKIENLERTIREKDTEIYILKSEAKTRRETIYEKLDNFKKNGKALQRIYAESTDKTWELSKKFDNLSKLYQESMARISFLIEENTALKLEINKDNQNSFLDKKAENQPKPSPERKEDFSTDTIYNLDPLFTELNLGYNTSPSSKIGLLFSIGRSIPCPSVEANFIEALNLTLKKDSLAVFITLNDIDLDEIQQAMMKKLRLIPRNQIPKPISQLLLIFSWIYKSAIIVIQPAELFGKSRDREIYRAVKIHHQNGLQYLTEHELSDYIADTHENPIILGLHTESKKYTSTAKFFHIYKKSVDPIEDTKTELVEDIDKLLWQSAPPEQPDSATKQASMHESHF